MNETKYGKYIIDTPRVGRLGYGVLPEGEKMKGRTMSHTYIDEALIEGVAKHVFISGIHTVPDPNPWLEFHAHPHDEILLFMGTDPHDIERLGAEVEILIGDEKESHVINKTSGVYIPRGVKHILIYRKVDRPHFLVGFSMSGEYR
ncbi:MAG: hypothetical protein JSV27_04580 [Candidatus Bathyarchaeota archaeon]|nr:MAG: hypothetical protein JSV27_04580 [Candidatus Bathyarchaeota archaeon]